MAFEFHADKQRYFQIQYENSKTSVLPFVSEHVKIGAETRVLEIGCAEAGVLKPFLELGATCVGIELHAERIEWAKKFLGDYIDKGKLSFIARNIYDIDVEKDLEKKFDLVILKDVIEHIHDQGKFIARLGDFLNPGGKVFFGFPPWYMPFGGHQQIAKNKLLSKLPYYHLLPASLYGAVLKTGGETERTIADLQEIKETGISTARFEKLLKKNHFVITKKQMYLISPIYSYKFNLKPMKQVPGLSSIPFVRDFVTTAAYYLVGK